MGELPLRPLVGLFAALLLGSQLIHEAQDRDDDVVGEVRTVATEGGRRTALLAAQALVITTPILGWYLAEGVSRRLEITAACAVFAVAWERSCGRGRAATTAPSSRASACATATRRSAWEPSCSPRCGAEPAAPPGAAP